MKTVIAMTLFLGGLSFSNAKSFDAEREIIKDAKWAVLKETMIHCVGSARSTSGWKIEKINPAPDCPGPFEDENPGACVVTYKVSADFECL